MQKEKNAKYFVVYFMAVILVLIIHYFFVSKIDINSTIQVFIDLIIFMLSLGFSSIVYDLIKKHKKRK